MSMLTKSGMENWCHNMAFFLIPYHPHPADKSDHVPSKVQLLCMAHVLHYLVSGQSSTRQLGSWPCSHTRSMPRVGSSLYLSSTLHLQPTWFPADMVGCLWSRFPNNVPDLSAHLLD